LFVSKVDKNSLSQLFTFSGNAFNSCNFVLTCPAEGGICVINLMKSQIFTRKYIFYALIVLLIILIKLMSLNRDWVENYYSTSLFSKVIGWILRVMTGWLPISLGDLIYIGVIIWLGWIIVRVIKTIFRKKTTKAWWLSGFKRALIISCIVYIIFNIFWGLNYDRKGIANQLDLDVKRYTLDDLKAIDSLLVQKVNASKRQLIEAKTAYLTKKEMFNRASACYEEAQRQYPFLQYKMVSVKPSMFSWVGNYLGFTGYYNPFTGEAQINTLVPKFTQPFVTVHEIAHQLGYAKEDEANFVGYLAATSSKDTAFQYSTYLDLFIYANREVFFHDSTYARSISKSLIPEVKADLKEERDFWLKHRNPIEPAINWMYGRYLMANRQPKGIETYNEVIANLIAFYKKYNRI
jgi:hypothetical protein